MKRIKEFKNVYLEYPDELVLKEEEINKLKYEKAKLNETIIKLSKEEILERVEIFDRSHSR